MNASVASLPSIIVDRTHLGRRASGLERITRELFHDGALPGLSVSGTGSPGSKLGMVAAQMLGNPLRALVDPSRTWIFPGYPPSPLFGLLGDERSVLYVHDLFLLTRRQDLNRAGRLYMAPLFRQALKRMRNFLTNSLTTAAELREHVGPGARIVPYRPLARNVLNLNAMTDAAVARRDRIVLGAMGTIEPRKNLMEAVQVQRALAQRLGRPVELQIVGRAGWGGEADRLRGLDDVHLLGFVEDARMPATVAGWDILITTSHDEGLGLPLLEVQHSGLAVAAPDRPVFREVLGRSGLLFAPGAPERAAAQIAQMLSAPDWRLRQSELASVNIARWNALAEGDQRQVADFLTMLGRRRATRAGAFPRQSAAAE